ncbi:MAG: L,D-transpeptidase [Acidimicrobiia bacterium]|jgi:lipoprotein-anchoring transpeptidase ErfK/SrfK
MRIRALLIAVALIAVACGTGGVSASTPRPIVAAPAIEALVDDPPFASPAVGPTQPLWAGFEATSTEDATLAARANGPLEVFEEPGASAPKLTLDATTILGTVTVLGVVSAPVDGWVEVMLPIRPNGSTGWVDAGQVSLYVADSLIVVELEARRLTYLVDGVEVLTTDVGVGSLYNQTPPGEYFVTDNVTMANPNSPWGPHALGLSARSESITSYNGGDGIIGIHGTNNPSSIGSNISLGCVRLPNDMITALHDMVPIGTRVEIRA